MKTKNVLLWVFWTLAVLVFFGAIILGYLGKDFRDVRNFFKKKEVVVYTPTYLPINSHNFSWIALKKAVTENKIPSRIGAEDLGYYIADNPENYARIIFIEDTVRFEKAKKYQEKYMFSSIVIICREGSHLPFAYEDFLNLPSYKKDIYLIENKSSFRRIPSYVVLVGDSLYLYDTKLRELLRR